MVEREKLIRAMEYCTGDIVPVDENDECLGDVCPFKEGGYESGDCQENMIRAALALLKEQEPRVIPLSELLTFDAKWQFNTPPYLCTEEIDIKRMWWRSWRDIYLSIRCEGTMGSNNYGTEWRCWTFHPTEEQRKAAAWDG